MFEKLYRAVLLVAFGGVIFLVTAGPVRAVNPLIFVGNWMIGQSVTTDLTTKTIRFGVAHYDNSLEPVPGFVATSNLGLNTMNFGGGTSLGTVATYLGFYTHSDYTYSPVTVQDTLDTERLRIYADGKITGGQPAFAGSDRKAAIIPRVALQGTGALTNGTTTTAIGYIDATPVGEWTGIDGDVVTSTDTTFYKEGTASLKVAIAAGAEAADTILNPLAGGDEDWSGRERVGVWVYTNVALDAADFAFRITDSVAGNTDIDFPAIVASTATIPAWTWVELDISGVADASKDVITDIAFVMAVDKGSMNIYFDFLAKWDAADEIALDYDVQPDGMLSIIANPVASGSAMAFTTKTEYTNYFVNYAVSGNGTVVVITDESLNCFIMSYSYL